jgi:hypothetical protein
MFYNSKDVATSDFITQDSAFASNLMPTSDFSLQDLFAIFSRQ